MINDISKEWTISRKHFHIWKYLSGQDIKSRFRRSRLGVLWVVMQQLAFSLGAGFIWATVFHTSPEDFIPFLTLGFALWAFISGVMLEGCSAFVVAHGYLKQLPLPQSIFIFRTLLTQFFFLSIGFTIAIGILGVFGKLNPIGVLLSVPGVMILIFYAYGAIGTSAYLGLRYRDLQHGLSGIFSLLFVLTPVIYPPEILIKKGLYFAIYTNPFASLIEIVRYPLLYNDFASGFHYLISILFSLVLIIARFYLGNNWGRFVPFWS